MCPSFSFGFEGWIWDLIVLIPEHCHSILFSKQELFSKKTSSDVLHLIAEPNLCQLLKGSEGDGRRVGSGRAVAL